MARNNLQCFDVDQLNNDTCTFIGYGNSASRWLDHIVGREHAHVKVNNINVMNNIIGSDHLPIVCSIEISSMESSVSNPIYNECELNEYNESFINWQALTYNEFMNINELVCFKLSSLSEKPVLQCCTIGCHQHDHLKEIDYIYQSICIALADSTETYKQKCIETDKFKVIPGWNREVKSFHNIARTTFLKWVATGKNRNTQEFADMVQSRSNFKKALKQCKQNENNERCKSIINAFHLKNKNKFWKEVQHKKGKEKTTNIIDGQSDPNDIIGIFTDLYLSQNDQANLDEMEGFMNKFKGLWNNSRKMNIVMSNVSLKRAIDRLNDGVGHDGIHSQFLVNASDHVLSLLSHFFNVCFSHCYLPSDLLKGTISPVVKDKKGNTTLSSNFRPVMQSSCLLKIFEIHLLDILEEKVNLNCKQFGFRSGVSTTDACLILKELMYEYSHKKDSGIITFIDLSKAFDCVNHVLLGHKLLDKGVPVDVVFIVMHYLRNQMASVKWKGQQGSFHFIERGVRQGGILSPFLFKLYIDSILQVLSDMNNGCRLGLSNINVLAYADDIALVAHKKEDMDRIYVTFKSELENHDLIINKSKSKCMLFRRKGRATPANTIQLDNDTLDIVTSFKYLGHIISSSLHDNEDIDFRLRSFYASFNSVLRNFKQVDKKTLLFLYNSYCKPDYGTPLWNHTKTFPSCSFKTFSLAINKAMKKMVGVPIYSSNHEVADSCELLLPKHHVAHIQARYYNRLIKSKHILIRLNWHHIQSGFFMKSVHTLFHDTYNIDLWKYDMDTVNARIWWVQRHEERRTPVNFVPPPR